MTAKVRELHEGQIAAAHRQMIRIDGPRAASWLLWQARGQLHRAGAVDFIFRGPVEGRKAEKEPKYFLYAMALLRMRSRNWDVQVAWGGDGSKSYRVRWRAWHTNGPKYRAENAVRQEELKRRARNARKRMRAKWIH